MLRKWFLACGVLVIAGFFFLCVPTPPRPATRAELRQLESRFPAVRETLEQLVLVYRQGNHLAQIRDSLFAAGETLRVRQLEREYNAGVVGLRPLYPVGEGSIVVSDSLMYIEAWARRGRGFDAPWSSAGYAYASWPTRARWIHKHLGGHWYLYSIPAGWGD